ncbi:MAG: hypothetical protein OWS74_02685 [Firmicutes bacterium]|nr:hypothetical protein [Bacillota bacterium]
MAARQHVGDLISVLNPTKIRMTLGIVWLAGKVSKNPSLPLIAGSDAFHPTNHRRTRIKFLS